jgi:hypothetical protein
MNKTFPLVLITVFFASLPGLSALSFGDADIDFGDDDQEKFDNNGDSVVLSYDVTLDASDDYTNIVVTYNPTGEVDVGSYITFINIPTTMANGEQVTITLELTIPEDFDAVDSELDESEFDIGMVEVTGDDSTSAQQQDIIDITLQVKNEVELDKLEMKRPDEDRKDITSSSPVEIVAEEEIEFIFHIKNLFDESTDVEMSTLDIDFDVEDIGDESTSINGVDAGQVKVDSIEFEAQDDETGFFDVTISISATDEHGGLHGLVHEFSLDVNKAPEEPEDSDGDGVYDPQDQCASTPTYCTVDSQGCQIDQDSDGICDAIDSVDDRLEEQEEEQQENQQVVQQQAPPEIQPVTDESDEEEHVEDKNDDESTSFLPFVFGFIAGAVIASGFFLLLKGD